MPADPEPVDVEALLAAAATDATVRPTFVTALLESTVFVPGTVSGERTVNLANLIGPDGQSRQPFYTSEERLNETVLAVPGFERSFITLPCRGLWEMTRGATLVLNPHSAHAKEFLPGEIAQQLDGAATLTEHVVQVATQIMVGQPAHVPPGMTDALATLFREHREVDEARLGWKVTPQEDSFDESYLLVIVGDASARDRLGPGLAKTLVAYSTAHPVDVMYAEPGAGHVLGDVPPFYRRRRGLFRRG